MARLTAKQTEHLRALMDERFVREMEEIHAVAERSRSERSQELMAGRPADQLDAALADVTLASDYAVVRQDVLDVRDILAARRRLAAGHYGICIDCGTDIAYRRLLAYPTAKRCIDCQREHEGEGAVRGGRRVPVA
ncbi:MAG: TraR/DksA family transcriptional regulator [Gammaproteobacteria bacterium]